jgi:periplasmic divalent cation tolerance protein
VNAIPHEVGGTERILRVVYCAFPDAAIARRVGEAAVARKLAACVNRFSIDSTYHWNGSIERTREVVALFKTSPRKVGALFEFLAREHPYEVPDIFELPVARTHRPYLEYLAATLEPDLRIPPERPSGRRPVTRPAARRGPATRALRRTRAPHRRPSTRTGRHR